MTEPKRKAGRPRKVVGEVNPDCEPATKGYVKCLLRKTRDHSHEQSYDFGWCSLMSFGALVYVAASLFLSAIVIDQGEIGCMETCGVTQKEPKEIQTCCSSQSIEWSAAKQEAFAQWYTSHGNKKCE